MPLAYPKPFRTVAFWNRPSAARRRMLLGPLRSLMLFNPKMKRSEVSA